MINELLQNKFSEKDFTEYVSSYLPDFSPTNSRTEQRRGFSAVKQIGECPSLDLVVFMTTPEASINARIEISKNSYALLKTHPRAHALIAYQSSESPEWRLSLITTQVTRDKSGIKETVSNPRRFSYVLGPEAKVNTPTKYLLVKGKILDFNDLKERFSLEVVNKDFYKEISHLFAKLTGGTFGVGRVKKTYESLLKLPSVPERSQTSQEFAVRLIGRVIFSWFLREKKSTSDKSLMPTGLLSLGAVKKNPDYYHSILEPIFFEILNKPTGVRKGEYNNELFSAIPYLNGGLFSPHYDDFFSYNEGKQTVFHNTVVVPDSWIQEFFEFLETYHFTIDENISFDEELSIDPEMLGRIFENLLAEINPETGESARKSTGSYYTPRTVVDYMVDESLISYLKEKTQITEEKIRATVSYDLSDDQDYPLSNKEQEEIVNALSNIKILDPACGSGAFPMGALQKIVFILQNVDPDGQKWFNKQLKTTAPEIRKVIEREFANKNFNYIRKLGVIRENIFGVDIQPIATEISRLRCFLTLVVDESIHDELENRGIEPLPNLDFKFVTANTLFGLPDASTSGTLFEDRSGISELAELRDAFFTASGPERDQLKLQFVQVQRGMLEKLINSNIRGHADLTSKLTTWDPFSHKMSSWFDPEWMFGIKDFNIVIGNPPYISYGLRDAQKMSKEEKELIRKTFPESAEYKISLYALFIDKAIRLANTEGGIQTFIVPDSFLLGRYFSKIRAHILKNNEIIKFLLFPYGVFDATVGFSTVYFFKKTRSVSKDNKLTIYSPNSPEDLASNKGISFSYSQDYFNKTKYNRFRLFFDTDTMTLITKIESKSIELGSEYIGRTGVRSKIGQKNIISKEKKADTYQPGIISGGQIKRYRIQYDNDYINIDPNILNSGGWDYDVIHNPKILIRQTADNLIASIDTNGYYHLNNVHSFAPKNGSSIELEYVLAILNSSLMNYFYQKTTLEVGRAMAQTDIETIESLPLRIAESKTKGLVIKTVQNILSKTKQSLDADISDLVNELDELIFSIYEINDEERDRIKREVKL